ncbi:endonuclease [Bacillus nakamurai]|uniref:5'-nucleotidase C-terminal domain-containing protein n=1 Tax=Bacillus nakamurai TaxID=1793963 RepID=UPI0007784939|nr:5'-nucleotidase C-terminal domain-containing protein [Bacillus nakamurai]KXZ23947.1 endonuclease [Bacillus nakamurai]
MRRKSSIRLFCLLLTVCLVIPNVLLYAGAARAITAEEALQKKEGNAEGNAGQAGSGDGKLLLDGGKTEISPEKALPVHIPSVYKDKFNPNVRGKKISVQENLTNVSQTIEAKDIKTLSVSPSSQTSIPIKEARAERNKRVTVKGIVTADQAAIGGGKLSTFIQDDSGGVNIYSASANNFPELKEGMEAVVSGKTAVYQGLTEIIPDSIQITGEHKPLPEPRRLILKDLQDKDSIYEGQLVTVKAYLSSLPGSPAGGGYNSVITDEDNRSLTLRIMEETNVTQHLQTGRWYNITGVLGKYQSLQLLPRKPEDVSLLDEQPKPPSAEGEYQAVVDRIVDGDTINVRTPILGTSKIRLVNTDTPETYHTPKNELDENQLYFGKKASDYVKTILAPGDQITVKVGQEAKDTYGRMLGQIITEKGMNVNLELVKNGYAATYFIWPVQDNTEYETFQQAAAKAIQEKKGIWNEENPLKEMPFEFRARETGKGLTRYVGDSSDRTYVSPEEWKKVTAEHRIFFSSEKEAENAGYKKRQKADEGNVPLRIISMNDLHGKIDQQYGHDLNGDGKPDGTFGRMDYAAAYIKKAKAEKDHTLVVHAGDMIGGSSPVSALFQDEPTIEMMEDIGFDVGTVGNHEFDEGTDELLRIINGGEHPGGKGTSGYDGQNFPLVCANCKLKSTGAPFLPSYEIKNVSGIPVAFIGVVTKSAAGMVMPEGIKDITFTDEVKAVNEAAAELKKKGIKAIAVLAHMSAEQNGDKITGESAKLANETDSEIDVIFAAHNHKVVNGEVNGKLIVQAFEYGKAIGIADLELNKDSKDIVKKSAEIEYIDQSKIKPDPNAAGILSKYEEKVKPIISEVAGEAAHDITGGYSNDGDTALGNLIADGMKAKMNSDFALMNGGGIRDSIKKGPITWGDLYNIQPFGNVLTKLEIKGKDLREIINAQISPTLGPDYSISGFSYTWDPKTAKAVDMKMADGTDIQPEAVYTLTVNNFMATAAGAKYGPIGKLGKNPATGPEDLEATLAFVKSFKTPISYQAEGRIQTAKGAETPDDGSNPPGKGEEPDGGSQPDNGEKPDQPERPNQEEKPDSPEQPNSEEQPGDTVHSGNKTGPAPVSYRENGAEQTESGTPDGHSLPDTSAGHYQIILIGIAITGSGVYWYSRKKRRTRMQ